MIFAATTIILAVLAFWTIRAGKAATMLQKVVLWRLVELSLTMVMCLTAIGIVITGLIAPANSLPAGYTTCFFTLLFVYNVVEFLRVGSCIFKKNRVI